MSLRTSLRLALAVSLTGCASSAFSNSWHDPAATPVALNGQQVLAVVQMSDEASRRAAEDALAAEITKRGAIGVPSYSIFTTAAVRDTAAAKATAQRLGITGVVMMRMIGTEQVVRPSGTMGTAIYPSDPFYRQPWGAWGRGWTTVYIAEPDRVETRVLIETRVYSLVQERLLWAGTSSEFKARSAATVARELAGSVAQELQRVGVLAAPAK